MKKLFLSGLLLSSVMLAACSDKAEEEVATEESTVGAEEEKSIEERAKENFLTGFSLNEEGQPVATLTYVGEQEEVTITHNENIFFLSIYGVGNDFSHEGRVVAADKTTTLKRDETISETFDWYKDLKLEPGTYTFMTSADFSFDFEDEKDFHVAISELRDEQIK